MKRFLTPLIIYLTVLALAGCATHVELSGSFPQPHSAKLPVSAVVVFDQVFKNYRFENKDGPKISISVGQTQVDLFTVVTTSMFREVSFANSLPATTDSDLIIFPIVEEVQISTPGQTKLNVFEVWIKYNLQVRDGNGEPIADWIMSAYGKTPTKLLKSSSEALNQASIVALRDAGAHLIIGFTRVPEIRQWLENRPDRNKPVAKQHNGDPPPSNSQVDG